MGIRINKKIALQEKAVMLCPKCNCEFPIGTLFCTQCGQKLQKRSVKLYANVTARGISSISLKTPQGTINSKGSMSIPLGGGTSYTIPKRKKKN